jgi:hypothetical protein
VIRIGITGFALAGRALLFDALCLARGVAPPAQKHQEPRVIHLPIPDPVFDRLVARFTPKKAVAPSLELVECAELPEDPNHFHGVLAGAAANVSLVVLVCGGPVAEKDSSPQRAVSEYLEAIAGSEKGIIERRLDQIHTGLKKGKKEDVALGALLESLRKRLSESVVISPASLTREEAGAAANFVLISALPHLVVVNTADCEGARRRQSEWKHPFPIAAADLSLEKDLLELPESERKAFMASYGLETLGVVSLLEEIRRAVSRTVFYTMNARELHAWDVPAGTTAVHAAGVIHSDMERGFIRAEIIAAEDLLRAGSMTEAHHAGLVRTESKDYVVKDRDIMTVHFNV